MNKWYEHNPDSFLENKMHKLLWDFVIQMDHLISVRWTCNNQQKKESLSNCDVLADQRVKLKESEKKDNNLGLARELRNMKVMGIQIVIGTLGTVTKG